MEEEEARRRVKAVVAVEEYQDSHKQMQQEEEKDRSKKMKVLVAMDESEGSLDALKWAIQHLLFPSVDDGEEVTLLHVQQTFQHYFFPAGPGPAALYPPPSVLDSVKKAQEENSAALISKALHVCEERGFKKITSMVLEGEPKDMICSAVEQIHPDLLVVGSRGLGKVKRAFLGSVSDYCAHHAKCPVLIVKPPQIT